MKNMEQLQKAYEKEMKLTEQHKKNATDIKKQMESLQNKNISQKISSLNMNGAEYDRFMKLLGSDKKTVFEAVEIVLGTTVTADTATTAVIENMAVQDEEFGGGEESAKEEF